MSRFTITVRVSAELHKALVRESGLLTHELSRCVSLNRVCELKLGQKLSHEALKRLVIESGPVGRPAHNGESGPVGRPAHNGESGPVGRPAHNGVANNDRTGGQDVGDATDGTAVLGE